MPLVPISRRGRFVPPLRATQVLSGGKEFSFDPPEPQSPEELERERIAAGDRDWLGKVQPPEFVLDLLRRGTSPEEIIDVLSHRAHELDDLRRAASVLHELAHIGYRPLVTDALRAWARDAFKPK